MLALIRGAWFGGIVVGAVVAGCVSPSGTVCANGNECPAGSRCVQTGATEADLRCATPIQDTGCAGLNEGDVCTEPEPGTCIGGACFASVCGDGIQDGPEQCDDLNTDDGDGCSSTCLSRETCGNSIVDGAAASAEQCDTGVTGLAGDGCSSQCLSEYLLWRSAEGMPLRGRDWPLVVSAPQGDGVLLFGGGTIAPTNNLVGAPQFLDVFDELVRWDGWAWTRVDAPARPPARGAAAGALDPGRQRVVLFGGRNSGGLLADTWEWDGVTWRERTPPTGPPARAAAAMACAPELCILFGGGTSATLALDDTWLWDGTTWTELTIATPPTGRFGAGLAFDPTTGATPRFVLVGGIAGFAQLTDTWELRATQTPTGWQATWDPIPTLKAPDVVSGPSHAVYVPASVAGAAVDVYLVGVSSTAPVTSSLWRLDPTGWTSIGSAAGEVGGVGVDRRRGVIVGAPRGLGGAVEADGASWTLAPAPRIPTYVDGNAIMAFDPGRAATIVLTPDGTLAWNGRSLRKLALDSTLQGKEPAPSVYPSLAYDERCQQMITFGGIVRTGTVSAVSDEAWRLTSTGWVAIPASTPWPAARSSAMMTYDAAGQRILLYGGRANQDLGDLWALAGPCDAPTWQLLSDAAEPGPRSGGSLTYDAARGVVVLFGGEDSSGIVQMLFADVWELTGTTWRNPWMPAMGPGPVARTHHGAAFDPLTQQTIVLGGDLGAVDNYDPVTWAWNGSSWRALDVVVEPPPFTTVSLTRGPRGLIALGSVLGTDEMTKTMFGIARLTSEQISDLPETCVLDEDGDGDRLAGCADPDCWARCTPLCPPSQPATGCTTMRCGDGACDPAREDYLLCPTDCTAPS